MRAPPPPRRARRAAGGGGRRCRRCHGRRRPAGRWTRARAARRPWRCRRRGGSGRRRDPRDAGVGKPPRTPRQVRVGDDCDRACAGLDWTLRCARSSVDRALASGARGRRFKSCRACSEEIDHVDHRPRSTRLPAQDLDRARAFYRDKLGLEPAEERPGGLRYVSVTRSSSCSSPAEIRRERSRRWRSTSTTSRPPSRPSVSAGPWSRPSTGAISRRSTVDIAEIEGNYPSKGSGERAVWLRDSEGNLIGLGEVVP